MPDSNPALKPQFDDLAQQHSADEFGMWVFLATETLLFGALFLAYTAYRLTYHAGFMAGSHETHMALGTLNTVVLLTSSLTMVLAVHAAREGKRDRLVTLLLLTAILGLAFIGIKLTEYALEYRDGLVPGIKFSYGGPQAQSVGMFFVLYFVMTGLHAVHLTIGIVLVSVLVGLAIRGKFSPEHHAPVVLGGLYWHFIDVVWVFLYPAFYLMGRI